MHKNTHTLFNILLVVFVFSFFPTQNAVAGNKEEAIKLFENKQFSDALTLFKELNASAPEDASFGYYYGVCLVETNQFGQKAKELLLQSAKSNVPADINFFIGKNYHAINQFDSAMAYYTLFKSDAKSKELKATKVKELMELCPKRINPFEQSILPTVAESQTPELASTDQTTEETKAEEIETEDTFEEIELDTIPEELRDTIINFTITSEIVYRKIEQFRTTEGQKFFIEGFYSSSELTKLIEKVKGLRTDYQNSETREKKDQIAQEVLSLELQVPEIKSLSDIKFSNARDIEMLYWQDAEEKEIFKLNAENDSIDSLIAEIKAPEIISQPIVEIADTTNNEVVETTEVTEDTNQTAVTTPSNNQIIYKIQIGAYKTELPPAAKALYKKLSILRRIDKYTDEKGVTVYSIGEVANFKDAVKLQEQIRNESIKDAFIIIFKDGKKLPWAEAKAYMK
jgi:hypothetical protein